MKSVCENGKPFGDIARGVTKVKLACVIVVCLVVDEVLFGNVR